MRRRKRKGAKNAVILFIVLILALAAVVVLLVRCGSSRRESESVSTQESTTPETSSQESTPEVVDIPNEKPVTLYLRDSQQKLCTKITELNDPWTDTADLAMFVAFLYDEDSVTYDAWVTAVKDSWNSVTSTATYKIGYELSFDLNGERILITILAPDDIENSEYLYCGDYPENGDYSGITGYMGVWLYDDMAHEVGDWYSHVTSATKTENTVLTSIKLRPTPQSGEISNLTLRGFSYSSDEEFDENGNYIGTHAYTVEITNGQ